MPRATRVLTAAERRGDPVIDTLILSLVEKGVWPDSNVCAERREFLNLPG